MLNKEECRTDLQNTLTGWLPTTITVQQSTDRARIKFTNDIWREQSS